jgi:hypothetical protein
MFGEGPDVHFQFSPSVARRPPQTGCGRSNTSAHRRNIPGGPSFHPGLRISYGDDAFPHTECPSEGRPTSELTSCCGRRRDFEAAAQHRRHGKLRADTGNAGCPAEPIEELT